MKNKIITFVISFVITVVAFLFVLYIEQKVFNPDGTSIVYVVKKDKLEKNYVVNEYNFDNLFEEQERRSDQIASEYIKDKEEAYDTILTTDLYKNEVLTINKFVSVEDELNGILDKREISINSSNSSDVVGGVLREGDKVDVLVTFKSGGKVKTEKALESAYISKVYDSSGSEISRNDKFKVALGITLTLSDENAKKLENSISSGSWSLIKVVD